LSGPPTWRQSNSCASFGPIPASSAVSISKVYKSEVFLCDAIKCKVSGKCKA
jgi:hypothetical protein